jgi:hypothetical protein
VADSGSGYNIWLFAVVDGSLFDCVIVLFGVE